MFDLHTLEGFEWDTGNARKNDKHGVSKSEAEQVFLNRPLLFMPDTSHSASEPRCHSLGITSAGRFLHITFTVRGGGKLIRVISARDMHQKERAIYAKRIEAGS